jgi:YesN/AraC family two-component response regulator
MNPQYKAIVIDDEPAAGRLMKSLLAEYKDGVNVIDEAGNGGEALEKIERLKPDLILFRYTNARLYRV